MNQKVLVTGASGLIGRYLVEALIDRGDEVIGLHRHSSLNSPLHRTETDSFVTEVLGDIRNYEILEDVLAYYEPDAVYHLAAMAKVAQAARSPLATYAVNVRGTWNVLEAVRRTLPDATVTHLSTDKVYGEGMGASVTDPLEPTGPYETSKIAADLVAQSYADRYELDVTIARSCNAVGYEPAGGRIVSNVIRTCLNGNDPVIFSNVLGVREYIYGDDLARALIHLAGTGGTHNVATGEILSQEKVVLEILKNFSNCAPVYRERESDVEEIENQSMQPSDFGWEPMYDFPAMIETTIEEFQTYGYV